MSLLKRIVLAILAASALSFVLMLIGQLLMDLSILSPDGFVPYTIIVTLLYFLTFWRVVKSKDRRKQ